MKLIDVFATPFRTTYHRARDCELEHRRMFGKGIHTTDARRSADSRNTIFEVIKATGRRTAWADKHRAYDLVDGPSGNGVDDPYTPEIASVAPNGKDYTKTFVDVKTYDDIKVRAIVNQIDGKTSTGGANVDVPAVFGMNFQAVSVGQKQKGGGYADASGTPSAALEDVLAHTDASIATMLAELGRKDLTKSTLVIVTAKHGQSPIDPTLRRGLDDGPYATTMSR